MTTFQSWTDPTEWKNELDDLRLMTDGVFAPDVPLRDRIAALLHMAKS